MERESVCLTGSTTRVLHTPQDKDQNPSESQELLKDLDHVGQTSDRLNLQDSPTGNQKTETSSQTDQGDHETSSAAEEEDKPLGPGPTDLHDVDRTSDRSNHPECPIEKLKSENSEHQNRGDFPPLEKPKIHLPDPIDRPGVEGYASKRDPQNPHQHSPTEPGDSVRYEATPDESKANGLHKNLPSEKLTVCVSNSTKGNGKDLDIDEKEHSTTKDCLQIQNPNIKDCASVKDQTSPDQPSPSKPGQRNSEDHERHELKPVESTENQLREDLPGENVTVSVSNFTRENWKHLDISETENPKTKECPSMNDQTNPDALGTDQRNSEYPTTNELKPVEIKERTFPVDSQVVQIHKDLCPNQTDAPPLPSENITGSISTLTQNLDSGETEKPNIKDLSTSNQKKIEICEIENSDTGDCHLREKPNMKDYASVSDQTNPDAVGPDRRNPEYPAGHEPTPDDSTENQLGEGLSSEDLTGAISNITKQNHKDLEFGERENPNTTDVPLVEKAKMKDCASMKDLPNPDQHAPSKLVQRNSEDPAGHDPKPVDSKEDLSSNHLTFSTSNFTKENQKKIEFCAIDSSDTKANIKDCASMKDLTNPDQHSPSKPDQKNSGNPAGNDPKPVNSKEKTLPGDLSSNNLTGSISNFTKQNSKDLENVLEVTEIVKPKSKDCPSMTHLTNQDQHPPSKPDQKNPGNPVGHEPTPHNSTAISLPEDLSSNNLTGLDSNFTKQNHEDLEIGETENPNTTDVPLTETAKMKDCASMKDLTNPDKQSPSRPNFTKENNEDLEVGICESKDLQNIQNLHDVESLPSPGDPPLTPLPRPSLPQISAPILGEPEPEQTPSVEVGSTASETKEPRLCGFLQKQAGPLRSWRQRWFSYEPLSHRLSYYRTPRDATPLGYVQLTHATFSFPLKAEAGTFHIKTPERTFILKALTQELMFYWLKQLQLKRSQHRQTHNNNNDDADDFLPVLSSPLGLVGEESANVSSLRTLLADMSLKHPLIHFQNSFQSLRKRPAQESSQSVFHVETPEWTSRQTDSMTPPPTGPAAMPLAEPDPAVLPFAEPSGQLPAAEGSQSPSLSDGGTGRWKKSRRSFKMAALRRDSASSDRTQQERERLLEEVKSQKELVWILHRALESSQMEKRSVSAFVSAPCDEARLELLRHGQRMTSDLTERLHHSERATEEMEKELRTLRERDLAKQEVIMKLSNQLSACLSDPPPGQETDRLREEIHNLKDDLSAYRTQNQFLNSELYQLTRLWRKSSEQEKSLMVKCCYLEASVCETESRYLSVLRQLQENKALAPAQREAVSRLIQAALKGGAKSAAKVSSDRDHDEYGFKIIPDYEVEDMKLLAKIQALEIRSHNLLLQEGSERPVLSRWAQYLAARSDDIISPSPELKALLRGGVPKEHRARVWRGLVWVRTRGMRERHPGRYTQLCEQSHSASHPACRQIELDLHRTLTTNQKFSSPLSPALQQLRRILLAFSWHNPEIGYCQGLNRLAAIALLVLQTEEEAFWCLVSVVEFIMPQDYYTKNLLASQADQRVLKDLLSEKLPRVSSHFVSHGVDVSLVTFNWFLVAFVESLPSDILLPLWDAFLYEGTKVMFRYALALFKYKEDDILKIQDSVEIYQYLRFFTKTISDPRKLTNIAFCDMNPFPGRVLTSRRAVHLDVLTGELVRLEQQQRDFNSDREEERVDKDLGTTASEDED